MRATCCRKGDDESRIVRAHGDVWVDGDNLFDSCHCEGSVRVEVKKGVELTGELSLARYLLPRRDGCGVVRHFDEPVARLEVKARSWESRRLVEVEMFP